MPTSTVLSSTRSSGKAGIQERQATPTETTDAFEALSRANDPFQPYPIVYLKLKR
jgi:hypothetical protein